MCIHTTSHAQISPGFWCPNVDRYYWCALSLVLVNACTGVYFREKCTNKDFHPRLRQQEPWLKKKKLPETCMNPEVRFLPQKYNSNRFFFLLRSCLAWESNSLNNYEWTKQHCTPLLKSMWKGNLEMCRNVLLMFLSKGLNNPFHTKICNLLCKVA